MNESVAGTESSLDEGAARAAITNGLVRLFARHYGKGPERGKTYVVEDYVFTVMEDPLTTAERTLVDRGRGDLVREVRLVFQQEMADEFKAVVERALHRPVMTYHSQVSFDPDYAFEIFVLGG
jgi:uncharacterized protein YbcI